MLKGSWRTNTLGFLTIIGAIVGYVKAAVDNDPSTIPDWPQTALGITAGWGLLVSRDNKVSSEEVGAAK